jgi:hypothetical protein
MARIKHEELPDGAKDVLSLLRRAHDETGEQWLKRQQLADVDGKKRLNTAQQIHLEYLHSLGFIEIERPVGEVAYLYRLIDGE